MKTLHSIVALAFLSHPHVHAQQWALALARPGANVTITVPENSLIEFGTIRGGNQTGQSETISFGGTATSTAVNGSILGADKKYVGPLTITASVTGTSAAFYAIPYRITNSAEVSAVPSNAVVIPADAAGGVQIILESSTDMVTWTAATPGTYGSSTQKRFFRVRAVGQ